MHSQDTFAKLTEVQRADLWAVLAMRHTVALGAVKVKKLVARYGSPYRAVMAHKEWGEVGLGITTRAVNAYATGSWRGKAKLDWAALQGCECGLILCTDQRYPELLKQIADSPLLLTYRGDISLLNAPSVAVVGSRNCTNEGVTVSLKIVRGLSRAGITIVSGMAKGIDAIVHEAALEGAGSTIAVLGSGIDVPYPKDNRALYEKLCKHALVLSEVMPGGVPHAANFPVRNRIISGLSKAVLVVEAGIKSGSLVTARHALEQNRDVYAVPGSTLSQTSEGCRELIRSGAKVVFSSDDVILELAPLLSADLELSKKRKKQKQQIEKVTTPAPKVAASDPKTELQTGEEQTAQNNTTTGNSAERMLDTSFAQKQAEDNDFFINTLAIPHKLDETETTIYKQLLKHAPIHIDTLALNLQMDISELASMLTMMEVKELLVRMPGMYYKLKQQGV